MANLNQRTIHMIIDELPGFDVEAANGVADFLESQGFAVDRVTAGDYIDPKRRTQGSPVGFLTLIPKPDVLPYQCYSVLSAYISRGGNVVTLGGSLFYRVVEKGADGRWALAEMDDKHDLDACFAGKVPHETLPGLMPNHQVYPVYGCSEFLVEPGQVIFKGQFSPGEALDGVCPIAYSDGAGYKKGHTARYIPLVQFMGKGDRADGRRGALAFLMAHHPKETRTSMLGSLGLMRQDVMNVRGAPELLLSVVKAVQRGVFLFEGGSDKFAYMPGESGRVGATVMNVTGEFVKALVRVTVSAGGRTVQKREGEVVVMPHAQSDIGFVFNDIAPREDYEIAVELFYEGELVDVIAHEAAVAYSKPCDPEEFVKVCGDNFMLRGKPWYPVGVNFWPLYVNGKDLQEVWMSDRHYIPKEAEYDLRLMRDMGMNSVSIQASGNVIENAIDGLLDFLRRCGNHGIKASISYTSAMTPIAYSDLGVRAFLERGRFAENANIFAYDTIWEPGNYLFAENFRPHWDRDWEKWIAERYGSVEKAEKDWGMEVNRDAKGLVTSPPTKEFAEDGPWRVRMAAYRRFMDDFMSRLYNDSVAKLRKADPNHLISHRQGNTLPHDYALTAVCKHLDFLCPEGYSIQDSEDGYNAACFITRFVDFTTRNKPSLWFEFGQSIQGTVWGHLEWDRERMLPPAENLAKQERYHSMYYRMVEETGINGTYPWWWPGGYRLDEKSDFGIIGPDGTVRPAGELIRKYAPLIKKERTRPEPQAYVTIDRDAHSGGYWSISFNEGKDAYAKAKMEGKWLGVRTLGTGTTSKDTPAIAVGNVQYDGANPPKYLNGEFNAVCVQNAEGIMQAVRNGGRAEVRGGRPVRIYASAGNLNEAEWIACGGTGCVVLKATLADAPGGTTALAGVKDAPNAAMPNANYLCVDIPLSRDTPYLADGNFEGSLPAVNSETIFVLRLEAKDRMVFGEKFVLTLSPV